MKLARAAKLFLAYTIGVILFGALVRATGSGAGCGAHWPLCNGEVIPREPEIQTMIEFTHRATSGLCLLGIIGLTWAAFRSRPKGHGARAWSVAALIFTISEALVGAALVLLEHVADNPSLKRGFSVSIHLVNTFLLVFCLTGLVRSLMELPMPRFRKALTSWSSTERVWLATGFALIMVGMTGAIAALGDTLWPAESLAHGWRAEFSSDAPLLLRLRAVHPFLAVATGLVVMRLGLTSGTRSGLWLASWVGIALGVGVLNLWLLAPVWMQMVHLLVADVVWILFAWTWFEVAHPRAA